jgi:hypothetical protein
MTISMYSRRQSSSSLLPNLPTTNPNRRRSACLFWSMTGSTLAAKRSAFALLEVMPHRCACVSFGYPAPGFPRRCNDFVQQAAVQLPNVVAYGDVARAMVTRSLVLLFRQCPWWSGGVAIDLAYRPRCISARPCR